MADTEPAAAAPPSANPQDPRAEYATRRFEAIMKVVSVVLGTMVVGLAGVIVPGVINSWSLDLERQKAYQAYITAFVEKGINQDIELRLRLAGYFANVSTADQKKNWQDYEQQLKTQRKDIREAIDKEEKNLAEKCLGNNGKYDVVAIDKSRRWLEWYYTELGYAQPNRSVMPPSLEAIERRRLELYAETKAVVQRLASVGPSAAKTGADYRRFWELYRRDLIGIESPKVAERMIQFGKSLDQPELQDKFAGDAKAVVDQIDEETADRSTVPPAACSPLQSRKQP